MVRGGLNHRRSGWGGVGRGEEGLDPLKEDGTADSKGLEIGVLIRWCEEIIGVGREVSLSGGGGGDSGLEGAVVEVVGGCTTGSYRMDPTV